MATQLYADGWKQDAPKRYTIATASTGGTYYPVGVGIATIASMQLAAKHRMTFSALASAGSAENIDMIDKGEVDFAIVQGLFASMVRQGSGIYQGHPRTNMLAISMLWQNVEQFVLCHEYVETGTILDLKHLYGKPFSIGKRHSGSRISGETLLRTLEIAYDRMDLRYLGYGASALAMEKHTIEGMNIPAGVPAGAVAQAYDRIGADRITILEFTDAQVKRVRDAFPIWNRYTIPAHTYAGQHRALRTIAQPNLLIAARDTPEETVYRLTKTLYENLPFLHTVHAATHAIALERAITGLPMPLHPGAIRYYRERGLSIPDALIVS